MELIALSLKKIKLSATILGKILGNSWFMNITSFIKKNWYWGTYVPGMNDASLTQGMCFWERDEENRLISS